MLYSDYEALKYLNNKKKLVGDVICELSFCKPIIFLLNISMVLKILLLMLKAENISYLFSCK